MVLHRSSTESEAKSDIDSASDCGPDKGNQPIRWCQCDEKNAQINQISSTNTMTERVNTFGKSVAQPSTTDSIDGEADPQPARNDPSNHEATPKPAEKHQLNCKTTVQPEKMQSLDIESSPGLHLLDHESSTQPAEDTDIEAPGQHSLVAYSSSASLDTLEDL